MNTEHLTKGQMSALHVIAGAMVLPLDVPSIEVVSDVLRLRLSGEERAQLLRLLLQSADPNDVRDQINDLLPDYLAGSPLPVFDDIKDDAVWWADLATLPELQMLLVACFVRLPASDQRAFLEAVSGRAAN